MSAQLIRRSDHHRGFSLVELMVALVLGLILTGGVINIYISSKQTYRLQDNQSRVQENGRFALQYLSKDLRMAGHMGCNNLNAFTPNIVAAPAPSFTLGTIILGYDTNPWPASFPAQPANLVPGTSVIQVSYAAPGVAVVAPLMTLTTDAINVSSGVNFAAGDTAFVTDCSSADIFTISTVTGGVLTHAAAISKIYGSDAMVMKFTQHMYYIGYIAGTACPCALYQQANFPLTPAALLVDNVQNMQITYGVDTNNDRAADIYVTAAAVPIWANVVSARVNLLVTTPDDNLVDKPQGYVFNSVSSTAANRRLYSSFSDTITFRNRAP